MNVSPHPFLRFATLPNSMAVCFLIFMFSHGLNLLAAGNNIDDWGHVAAGSDWGVLGRWGLELFYRYVLGTSFSISLQMAIAWTSLIGISFTLSHFFFRVWPSDQRNMAAIVIFAVGSTHPYWLDSHNFSTAIAAYPFTAFVGMLAFLGVAYFQEAKLMIQIGAAITCGLLFAISLSIYQPAALFGVVVAAAVCMQVTTVTLYHVFKTAILIVVVFILGLLLYRLQFQLYFDLHPNAQPNPLLATASFSTTFRKIAELFPLYGHSLRAGQFTAWSDLYWYLGGILIVWASTLAIGGVIMNRHHPVAAIRLVLGMLLGAVFPILGGWLLIEPDFPIRSLSLIAFPILFLTFQSVHEVWPRSASVFYVTAGLSVIVFGAGLLLTAVGWTKQQRSYERDLAVAYAIAGSLQNVPAGTNIVLAGNRSYPDLKPIATVGQSIFENHWAKIFIFKELYDLDVLPVPSSPLPCAAAPAPGSIVFQDGTAYACLQKFP